LQGLLRCETYPEGLSLPGPYPQINRLSQFEPWADVPYVKKLQNEQFAVRDHLYNWRPLKAGDRVRMRGRFVIENGHPGQELSDPAGNAAGYVWFELHPFDWLNIVLEPAPTPDRAVSTHRMFLPAPLYTAVYHDEVHVGGKTDNHYVYLGSSGGDLYYSTTVVTRELSAPPLPAGVDPSQLSVGYVETVETNTTGRAVDEVRQVTVTATGITVASNVQAPCTEEFNGVPIADYNDPAQDKNVFCASYDVYWMGRGGHLWHSMVQPDGGLTNVEDTNAQLPIPGPVRAVTAASVWGGRHDDVWRIHLLFTTFDGHLWHTVRAPDGTWSGLGDVNGQFAVPGAVRAVAAAAAPDEGHEDPDQAQFMFVTEDGHLWHTIRNSDGTWTGLDDVSGQVAIPGPVCTVAGAGFQYGAQFLFSTEDSHLWHTIRTSDGKWSGLGDVNGQFALPGPVRTVAAAGAGTDVQFLFSTDGGHLWHTIRTADGKWTGLGDVNAQLVPPEGGIPGIGPVGAHPILGDVTAIAGSSGPAGVQVFFVTDDGHAWRVLREPQGSWRPLNTVTGQVSTPQGADLPPVRSIAAAPDYAAQQVHVLMSSDWN
jgi:hypothetical protein